MPRKSTASTTAAAAAAADTAADTSTLSPAQAETPAQPTSPKPKKGKGKQEEDITSIDNLLLPRSLTSRISRGNVPANTSLHRDALLALTKAATVFISLLASEANDLTDKKTIQAQDVLKALVETEFWGYMGERVKRETEAWEEDVRGKRRGWRENQRARESLNKGQDAERETKRVRRSASQEDDAGDQEGDSMMQDVTGEPIVHRPLKIRLTNGKSRPDGESTGVDESTLPMGDTTLQDEEEEDDDGDSESEEGADEADEEDEENVPANGRVLDDVDRVEDVDEDGRARQKRVMAPGGAVDVGSDEESE